jgi:hypothetical protein
MFRSISTRRTNRWHTRDTNKLRIERLEVRTFLDAGFAFEALAFLNDPVPGGQIGNSDVAFDFDFEPGSLNNQGQLVFGADLTSGGEGVFFRDKRGDLTAMARTGDVAPDGATYGPIFLGHVSLNDHGESAFVIMRGLEIPFGVNAGLYQYSGRMATTTPLLLPGDATPEGDAFAGFGFRPIINNRSTIAFTGVLPSEIGPAADIGLGLGVFQIDKRGHVSTVVRPGDAGPNGSTFDFAQIPWLNDKGDVAFEGHVQEKECIQFPATSFPVGGNIYCAQSVYLRDGSTGKIKSIAEQGGPAPGGGTFFFAFAPTLNNRGDVAYIGVFPADPPGTGFEFTDGVSGIFLHTHDGQDIVVARPGDPMPGGGHLFSAGHFSGEVWINNRDTISFTGTLDTDDNGDGFKDTGLYEWSHGKLSIVARTGTSIAGVGTIQSFHPPGLLGFGSTFSGASLNDRGQIVFQATLSDGRGVMLMATPSGKAANAIAMVGDVNSDGRFDSSDLVQVFMAGEYEDHVFGNSKFEEGDWNGDGEFDSSDLLSAFQQGHYIVEARRPANGIGRQVDSFFEQYGEAGRGKRFQLLDVVLAGEGYEVEL